MAKDLKIAVPLVEMQTATTEQNLSLTNFCKLNQVPPKTTVWKYCQAAGIDTSNGLTVASEDALRHEYGLPLVSEVQTAIEESKIKAQQAIADDVDGVIEGEIIHTPGNGLGRIFEGHERPQIVVHQTIHINQGNHEELALEAKNAETNAASMFQALLNGVGQVASNKAKSAMNTLDLAQQMIVERGMGTMLDEVNGTQNPIASQEPHTPPPMEPKQGGKK